MADWRPTKRPAPGQFPTALPNAPDVQSWSAPTQPASSRQTSSLAHADPAWTAFAFASPPASAVTPARGVGPARPRAVTTTPCQPSLRPPAPSRHPSASSAQSDDGPEWATEFGGEFLTAQALAAQRGRSGGCRSRPYSRPTSRGGPGPRSKPWAAVPTEEEVFEILAAYVAEQPLLPLLPAAETTAAAPQGDHRGRRAHPLTLEPSSTVAWNFDRLFSRPARLREADLTHARWADEQAPGPPGAGGGGGEAWGGGVEARKQRAVGRLEAVARHLQGTGG